MRPRSALPVDQPMAPACHSLAAASRPVDAWLVPLPLIVASPGLPLAPTSASPAGLAWDRGRAGAGRSPESCRPVYL